MAGARPLEEALLRATKAGEVARGKEIGSCRGPGRGCGDEDEQQDVVRVIVEAELYVTRTRGVRRAVPHCKMGAV